MPTGSKNLGHRGLVFKSAQASEEPLKTRNNASLSAETKTILLRSSQFSQILLGTQQWLLLTF